MICPKGPGKCPFWCWGFGCLEGYDDEDEGEVPTKFQFDLAMLPQLEKRLDEARLDGHEEIEFSTRTFEKIVGSLKRDAQGAQRELSAAQGIARGMNAPMGS